jgi:uncharacterized Ntn-hydrolase superfamily protein
LEKDETMNFHYTDLYTTYSIVARDPITGQLGVAVQTHQMTVGRVVPWLLPGVGALATQSLANISFGPMGLAMLREGVPAPKVIEALVASDEGAHRRQVAVVDAKGQVGAWTGGGCIAYAGHHLGEGYSVQANMMTNDTVIPAMAKAYESASGDIAERMVAALRVAQAEDGDIRGMQSAALKVVPADNLSLAEGRVDWLTVYDLRVDEHENPVEELARLVRLRGAQILDGEGHKAMRDGRRDEALEIWGLARSQAPELEELAFWQAMSLADQPNEVQAAAAILSSALATDSRRVHWIDLIRRLQACGLLERPGAADELIAALG